MIIGAAQSKLYILNTNYDPQPGEQLGLCHHPDGRNSHLRLYPWGTNPHHTWPCFVHLNVLSPQRQRQCKLKEKDKDEDKDKSPYDAPTPCIWMSPDHPHNTNSLYVNSGCHSECLHQIPNLNVKNCPPGSWQVSWMGHGVWQRRENVLKFLSLWGALHLCELLCTLSWCHKL